MSTQTAQPLDHTEAYNAVHHGIYAPVFFQKLANDYGIQPRNIEEAEQMLNMAASLRAAHDQRQMKAAASQGSILDVAEQHLKEALAREGFQFAPTVEQEIQKTAGNVAADPGMAAALLSLIIHNQPAA